MVEYPGYGIAEGRPTESTVRALAMNTYSFVTSSLRVPSSQIIVMGHSIGTGPACFLASELVKRGKTPKALILQSPYNSLCDLVTDLVSG